MNQRTDDRDRRRRALIVALALLSASALAASISVLIYAGRPAPQPDELTLAHQPGPVTSTPVPSTNQRQPSPTATAPRTHTAPPATTRPRQASRTGSSGGGGITWCGARPCSSYASGTPGPEPTRISTSPKPVKTSSRPKPSGPAYVAPKFHFNGVTSCTHLDDGRWEYTYSWTVTGVFFEVSWKADSDLHQTRRKVGYDGGPASVTHSGHNYFNGGGNPNGAQPTEGDQLYIKTPDGSAEYFPTDWQKLTITGCRD